MLDYWGIEQALKDMLDAHLGDVTVAVEEEMVFAEGMPFVGIYLDRREAPDRLQTLSAGTRVRYLLTFSLWVWALALEKDVAMRERNLLLAKVETILMGNRLWHEQIETSWIGGGEMLTGRTESNDFASGGEITLIADAVVIT